MFSKVHQVAKQMGQLRKLKRQIESIEGEGVAGGGMVRVRMNGARKVRQVRIDPKALRPGDVELLEDLVKAAMNDASRKIEQQMSEQLGSMGGALSELTGRR